MSTTRYLWESYGHIRKMNILVVEIPVVVRISQVLPEEPFIHRQL